MNFESFSDLIKEASKKELTPFNNKLITLLDQTNAKLSAEISEIRNTNPSSLTQKLSIKYMFLKSLFERNMKIKDFYQKSRHKKIRDKVLSKNLDKTFLTKDEREYAENYADELSNFFSFYEIFDYSVAKPPIDYFVQIFAVDDCVFFDDDIVELKKGRMYFLKRKLVEKLIENGVVKVL